MMLLFSAATFAQIKEPPSPPSPPPPVMITEKPKELQKVKEPDFQLPPLPPKPPVPPSLPDPAKKEELK